MKYLKLKYFIISLLFFVFLFFGIRYIFIFCINKQAEKNYLNRFEQRLNFINNIYKDREIINEKIELFLLVEDLKFHARQGKFSTINNFSDLCSYCDIDMVKMIDYTSRKINNAKYIKDNNLTYVFSENDKLLISKANIILKKECKNRQ